MNAVENDIIINFTPTGMLPTKEMTAHVPISVEEIIDDVLEAYDQGITMVHLHARDELGKPTHKKELYAKIIGGIRKYAKDLVIGVSLSGRNISDVKKRAEVLELENELKPDMGSLTLSSLNFNKVASINSPDTINELVKILNEKGVLPEFEAFDAGMINYAKYLENKKLIEAPFYFNLLLGNIACAQPDPLHIGVMIKDLPENTLWSLAGIGNAQLQVNSLSIAMGGGVRVGLEDNIWFDKKRTVKAKNIDLIKRIHRLIECNDADWMKPSEFRTKMNLKAGINGRYGRNIIK